MKKIISFSARTYVQLIAAYQLLRNRYRRSVSFTMIPLGAGLFKGHFKVA